MTNNNVDDFLSTRRILHNETPMNYKDALLYYLESQEIADIVTYQSERRFNLLNIRSRWSAHHKLSPKLALTRLRRGAIDTGEPWDDSMATEAVSIFPPPNHISRCVLGSKLMRLRRGTTAQEELRESLAWSVDTPLGSLSSS